VQLIDGICQDNYEPSKGELQIINKLKEEKQLCTFDTQKSYKNNTTDILENDSQA
jgi:hypothetical protein